MRAITAHQLRPLRQTLTQSQTGQKALAWPLGQKSQLGQIWQKLNKWHLQDNANSGEKTKKRCVIDVIMAIVEEEKA